MKAVTGVVVDIEGGNLQIKKGGREQLGYLENNIGGGGLLTELEDNAGTLKAKLRSPDCSIERVSMPSPNFMKLGDIVSVVKDEDGCEYYYLNHSSDRTWDFPRCPARERQMGKMARFCINWGLFIACLLGIFIAFAQGQVMGLNLTAGCFFVIAVYWMVWSLSVYPRAGRRRLKSAEDLMCSEKKRHAAFIKEAID